jgi:hypothetical protein
VVNFHDGIDHATYGDPDGTPNPVRDRLPVSIDFYNNDISNVDDNCIEADGAAHNIRVFRNRCFNHAHRPLSTQPVFGGPVYFVRNIVYHAPEGGALKFCFGSSGILVYHNTLIAAARWMLAPVSNLHFRNNLILGRSEVPDSPSRHSRITPPGLQRFPPERRCRKLFRMGFASVCSPRGLQPQTGDAKIQDPSGVQRGDRPGKHAFC